MKKSLRCICAAIFALAFCTGFVIHASAVERQINVFQNWAPATFCWRSPTMAEGPGAPPKSTRAKAG